MPGGTWTTQNKVRPGVYIRFQSTAQNNLTIGERGVVAICEPMSWGPVGQVMTVEAGADVLVDYGDGEIHYMSHVVSFLLSCV